MAAKTKKGKRKKEISIAAVIAIILVFAGIFYYFKLWVKPAKVYAPQVQNSIIFPNSGDTIIEGNTYHLKWTPGTGSTQIFLINKDYEKQGVSVSILDRVYNIPNSGSYSYNIPSNIPAGLYKIEVGNFTSGYFQINSK